MALTALLTAGAASAIVQVPRSIPFAPSIGAEGNVQQECQLQTRVPEAIQQASSDVLLVGTVSKSGRWLELSITEIHAPGGGFFSGPKWMTVSGKLYERSKLVGSFRAKRHSAAAKRTCGTLARIATALGRDIAAWLAAPSMNAELGSAR
jgi:hypothetical protein